MEVKKFVGLSSCPLLSAPTLTVNRFRAKPESKSTNFQSRAIFRQQRVLGASPRIVCSATERDGLETAVAVRNDRGPSLFYEPFLRSFILGLSMGAAFEAINVALKFVSLAHEVGYGDLFSVLPSTLERFSPVIVNDHIVGGFCWMAFYMIEVFAILKVLDKHAQNPEAAARSLRNLSTIPKMMLPRLKIFKYIFKILEFGSQMPLNLTLAGELTGVVPQRPANQVQSPVQGSIVTAPKKTKKPKFTPPILDPEQEPEGSDDSDDVIKDDNQPGVHRKREDARLKPGQMDLATAQFLRRQKELIDRRSYLKNFWYAAGISEKVKDKPVGVEILGEKLVLFRDLDGKIQCLQDVCPHRGAPLHMGWMSEVDGHSCVVCPYHGWAFDSEGKLRDVPAAEHSNEWPKKPLIESYPVVEKGGFIWLFHGSNRVPESERPPIPFVPELDSKGWKPVFGEIEFECNHWSVFENAIDMAHIHYLHSDSFGNDEMPQIRDMTCSTGNFGVDASFTLHNKPVNAMWEFSKVPEVHVTAKADLPSTSVIQFTLGNGLSFITFVNTVPISENRTVNRFALIRRLDVDKFGSHVFNMDVWDKLARDAMIKILTQDKAMVERLNPEVLGREISVKADLLQITFRKLREQFIAMGYGIDPKSKMLMQTETVQDM